MLRQVHWGVLDAPASIFFHIGFVYPAHAIFLWHLQDLPSVAQLLPPLPFLSSPALSSQAGDDLVLALLYTRDLAHYADLRIRHFHHQIINYTTLDAKE